MRFRLTQPAVTARIRNLEQTIGSALFSRGGGGMRLTERGEVLLKYAEKFESLHDLMTRDIVAPDALEGRLRIGVSETICPMLAAGTDRAAARALSAP